MHACRSTLEDPTELAETETRLAEARADQQAAQATLRSAGFAAEDAARIVEGGGTVALRAPVKGIVTEVQAAVGETRDAAGPPLARIAGEGPIRVEARLSHGLPKEARFELATTTGVTIPVALVAQAGLVDARDGTAPAWFEPTAGAKPQGDVRLPPGLSGKLRILLPPGAGVVVPAGAITSSGGKAVVVRRAGDAHRTVPVEIVARSGADALVAGRGPDPLGPGDQVAADGAAALAAPGGAR